MKAGLAAGTAALFAGRLARATEAGGASGVTTPVSTSPTKVALSNGNDRTDNIFRALNSVEKEIVQAIGNRRVVIKPNNVSATNQLASTHVDALTGILDFLKSVGKLENTIVAESAMSPTMQAFENLGYMPLVDKYKIKLVDLDKEKYQTILAFDQTDAKPHPVRVSSILANQTDNFIISACMLKTHDRAVATMSIKNIILGAPLKFPTSDAGSGGRGGRRGGFGGMFAGSDKPILHGGGAYGISINLSMLAPLLHPSLSVIDGFEGMQGNGPIFGTPVDHRVCVVSTDYLAADTVGAALMGIDPADIGYLSYLTAAKAGESDINKMEILGEPIEKLARKYQLSSSIQRQLKWKDAASVTAS